MHRMLFIYSLLLLSAPGHAAFFISPSGSDLSGTGTISQPWFSLSKAVEAANPGDTIYLRGGTYQYDATVSIEKKGTAALPFSVLAYHDEKPVLDFSEWKPEDEDERGAARGIKLTGEYWYFRGIEICNAPDNGVKCEGAHNTFDLCVFHHNGDSGLQIGLNKEDYDSNPDPDHIAAYNRVINCDSHRNADPATEYENADGFACKLYAGKDNSFYGCRAWENCDDGWDCFQTNHQITIENCWTWHNGDPSMWGLESFNGDGNGYKLGGDDEPCPILVKNCVAFDIHWGAMSAFTYNNNAMPVTLLNCIAWDCSRDFNMQDLAHVLKNCVAFNSTRLAPKDLSETAVQVNNSWNISGITASADDFISLDVALARAPRNVDGSLPDNGFARLKAGSDLIDKGMDIGLPYVGTAPDLGAYEYGLTSRAAFYSPSWIDLSSASDHRIRAGMFDLSGRAARSGIVAASSGLLITRRFDGIRQPGTTSLIKINKRMGNDPAN